MKRKLPKIHLSIWGLALGYFIFYVPYSAMTKGLSLGLFSGNTNSISGFELLPTVLFGTVVGFTIILLVTGWWRHAGTTRLFGTKIPFATNKYTFLSGVATSVIIAATTIAYSFTGVSIVFAALLMRGGVLLMAVFVDTVYHRKIQLFSWIAFGLTLFSLLIGFSEKAGFKLSLIAGINIIAYLSGYFFRLQFMTYAAKTDNVSTTYKYFVEEMLSVMVVILFVPALFALAGWGEIMLSLRAGYLSFLSSGLLLQALLIGLLYSGLHIFGSRIYLDHRENTFCIPINRCISLTAAIAAGIILSVIFDKQFYTNTQLFSAAILIIAILVLGFPPFINYIRGINPAAKQYYIFVCPGNTGRSPMAQSICIQRIMEKLRAKGAEKKIGNIRILSAAINGEEGLPMEDNAQLALQHLGIPVLQHVSHKLSIENILQAEKIWCISAEHKQLILEKFPEANGKINCLDDIEAIPAPHGKGLSAYIDCAERLQQVIDDLIFRKEIAFI
jgi:protein-tyrosine-phosphatase